MLTRKNKDLFAKQIPLLFVAVLSSLYSSVIKADVVSNLLGNSLVCVFAERERADMDIAPLYQVQDGQCKAVVPDADDGAWYSDNLCINPVVYSRTSMQDYCAAASNRKELGNGIGIREDSWSLTPGNRIDFGSRTLEGVSQPYVQRLVYRRVQTARGSCDLEMRVYKSHPTATAQRSMIAIHGGSWTARTFGFLGLELSIPHYVDQGFVVYAPFHRLLDDNSSSDACNQAEFIEVVDDVNFALDWVLDNAERYGSEGTPVAFGQSSGGHLALSLAINRPTDISGAVLMYPPTDFSDFVQRVQSGAYTNSEGLNALSRVVGGDANTADLTLPVVLENSFPQRVVSEGNDWPPMFIVQGAGDDLVEARQSVRLCEALSGRVLTDASQEVSSPTELRDVILCSNETTPQSQLHLIQKGKHALDVCISGNIAELCQSGGEASRSLVSQSISEGASFAVSAHEMAMARSGNSLGTVTPVNVPTDNTPSESEDSDAENGESEAAVSTGGGRGASMMFLLLLPSLVFRRRVYRTFGSIL